MNPFRAIKKAVTAPVTEARDAARMVRIYRAALRLMRLFQAASDDWDARRARGDDMSKSIFASKTFWFNVLMGANQLIGVVPIPNEYAALATAVVNVGLRLVSSDPVHVVPPKGQ